MYVQFTSCVYWVEILATINFHECTILSRFKSNVNSSTFGLPDVVMWSRGIRPYLNVAKNFRLPMPERFYIVGYTAIPRFCERGISPFRGICINWFRKNSIIINPSKLQSTLSDNNKHIISAEKI